MDTSEDQRTVEISVKPVTDRDGNVKPFLNYRDPAISQSIQKDIRERNKDRKENLDNLLFSCANPACQKQTRRADLKVCSRCKKDRYCSPACQKDHWPVHKKTCGTQSEPTLTSLSMKLAERSLAVTKIVEDLVGYATIALDLVSNPSAASSSYFRVPVIAQAADISAYLARLMSGQGTDPNAELGLTMKAFEIVPRDEAPENVRKSADDFREALVKKEGPNVLMVTYFFVPYHEEDSDDEAKKAATEEEEPPLLTRTFKVPQYQLDKVREGVVVEVNSSMFGNQKITLDQKNVDTIREGINNCVRMDKTNKLKLRGYLRG